MEQREHCRQQDGNEGILRGCSRAVAEHLRAIRHLYAETFHGFSSSVGEHWKAIARLHVQGLRWVLLGKSKPPDSDGTDSEKLPSAR